MTTSIDTNVLAALWNPADAIGDAALKLLGDARRRGALVIAAPVYGELMAGPLRTEAAIDRFLSDTEIEVDWRYGEELWRKAGRAFQSYVPRRRSSKGTFPRRILTDFLVGAHAQHHGYTLLTLDKRLYAAAFPRLRIIAA